MLAALGRELSVSKSRDLGDYLTTLRNATPDPVTLLTHQDRMSQLDLESRGGCLQIGPLMFNVLYKILLYSTGQSALIETEIIFCCKSTLSSTNAPYFVVCPRNFKLYLEIFS